MTTDTSLIWHHDHPNFTVELHGNQPIYRNNPACIVPVIGRANQLGAQPTRICWVHTPSKPGQRGFRSIANCSFERPVQAEGVVLEVASAAISQTADCPTVLFFNQRTHALVETHAGRAALEPDKTGHSVIHKAFTLVGGYKEPDQVLVVIVGAISGQHFLHDHLDAYPKAKPFWDRYGKNVFVQISKYGLDLVSVIRLQLQELRVPDVNIKHDALCTFAHPGLISHRQHQGKPRTTANTVIVVQK